MVRNQFVILVLISKQFVSGLILHNFGIIFSIA